MEKKTLYFKADNQSLVGQNVPARLASDTVSYIEAVFDLGENWSGFDAVKAVWSTDFDSLCTVLDSSGACVVPHEVLERVGDVWVNLVGSISEDETLTDRLTTYPIKAVVVDANAAVCGSETSPITPSQFDQFVEVVRADADRAEEGATEAAASAYGAAASATSASGSAADASQSASGASQSAQSASESAGSAAQSATSASESAADAEEAKDAILSMTATATTLPEGSQATVDYNNGVMAFGIPRGDKGAKGDTGDKGETGATPQMSIGTVETLAPDDDATATITGTAEAPVLSLGIPKGDTGEVSLLELIANTKVDEKSDSVPYQRRTLSGVGSHESLRKIVGGTVAWNQLFDYDNTTLNVTDLTITKDGNGVYLFNGTRNSTSTGNLSAEFQPYHVYYLTSNRADNDIVLSNNANWKNVNEYMMKPSIVWKPNLRVNIGTYTNAKFVPQIFDLTQMFGTTIADYIYSLEQANAGDGVAFFKSLFPEDYYPYNSGELKSVQTSAHKTYDADGNVIGNYPLDSSITLMGVPKLDASNILYYDGDTYASDGSVSRRYMEFEITGAYAIATANLRLPARVNLNPQINGLDVTCIVCDKCIVNNSSEGDTAWENQITCRGTYASAGAGAYMWFFFPLSIASTLEEANAWFATNKPHIVYELATPTTETASPYTELQEVESGGSEEFVGAEIPVGHESVYPRTLADTMPTADGSYTLALTVSGGKPSVEWEVNA